MTTMDVDKNLEARLLKEFPDVPVRKDGELAMYEEFVDAIGNTKWTTVRYGRDKIRVPAGRVIPMFETRRGDKEHKRPIGNVLIYAIDVKTIGELTEMDAMVDGMESRQELVDFIKGNYEPIYNAPVLDSDYVTIYRINRV